MRRFEVSDRTLWVLAIVSVVVECAVWIGVGCVIAHFVMKWW